MSSLSNHAETLLARWLLTADSVTRPTNWYAALYTAAPSDAGGGTEVSAGGYAREAVAFTVSGDTAANATAVEFGPASADWGTITHVAILDAATTGNLIAWAALSASKTVENTDTLEFASGELALVFA